MPRTSSAALAAALPPLLLGLPARAFAAGGGIELVPEPEILALNFAVLLLLIWPVNRLLIRPLVQLLEERERRGRGATERADELRNETTGLRDTLSDRLHQARAAAQTRRTEILTSAQDEEREILEGARREAARQVQGVRSTIAQESDDARRSLEGDARELAREAAAGILGRAL
jgi:F-type H+-transporting ATPase subunit b